MGHIHGVGLQGLLYGRDRGLDVGGKSVDCEHLTFRLGQAARHADSVVLLAGRCHPHNLRQEAGADGAGRIELASLDLERRGVQKDFAARIERLRRLVRTVEKVGRGADGLQRIAGKEDVAGTRRQRCFGIGPQNLATLRGEDQAHWFFFGVGREERGHQYRYEGKSRGKSAHFQAGTPSSR